MALRFLGGADAEEGGGEGREVKEGTGEGGIDRVGREGRVGRDERAGLEGR